MKKLGAALAVLVMSACGGDPSQQDIASSEAAATAPSQYQLTITVSNASSASTLGYPVPYVTEVKNGVRSILTVTPSTSTSSYRTYLALVDAGAMVTVDHTAATAPSTISGKLYDQTITIQRMYCDVYPDVCRARLDADPEWYPKPVTVFVPTPYTFTMTGTKTVTAAYKLTPISTFVPFSITNVQSYSAINDMTVCWVTDVPSTSQLFWGTTASLGTAGDFDATPATYHCKGMSGLASNTTYSFQAVSIDANGRVALSTTAQGQTLPPVIPSISGLTIDGSFDGPSGADVVVLSWTTDIPTTSTVSWRIGTGSWSTAWSDTTLRTDHTAAIYGAHPGTEYTFGILATAGSATGSWVGSFLAPPLP